jgi:hypothetical protein
MKNLRRLCAVLVLTVALSFSTFGGEILTPGIAQTPPPTTTTTTTSAATETCNLEPGEILTPGAALDPVTEAALSLLQSLFSIF